MGKVSALSEEWGTDAIGVMWRLKKQLGSQRELKPRGTALAENMCPQAWESRNAGALLALSLQQTEQGFFCTAFLLSKHCQPGLQCTRAQTVTLKGGCRPQSPRPLSLNEQCAVPPSLHIFSLDAWTSTRS